GRFSRATARFQRLVLLGHTGFLTLDALRWLADVGVGWVHLDPDGRVLGTSSSLGLDDPRLRRSQAMAWRAATGVAIARGLLRAKVVGQARVAISLPEGAAVASAIDELIPELN